MLSKFLLSIFVPLIFAQQIFAATVKCPTPPSAFNEKVKVDVSYDKKSKLYSYKYTLSNLKNSKVPIYGFYLQTLVNVSHINSAYRWRSENLNPRYENSIGWTGPNLKAGLEISGFEIQSANAPGPIKYLALGLPSDLPTIVSDDAMENEDAIPICPGFYAPGSSSKDDYVVGLTTGPTPPSRVVAQLRIKKMKDSKWRGHVDDDDDALELSPLDTGHIQVMLYSEDLDLSKVDISSLRFGQGQAKPLKTEIVTQVKEACDKDLEAHIKKNKSAKYLKMEFNLEDVNVHCDLDRALFLTGKYADKELFAGVKTKSVVCNKKTFIKEEKLIRKDGRFMEPE